MQSNSKDTLLKYKYLVSKRTPLLHQNLCQLYSGLRTSFLCRDRNQKINEIITKKKQNLFGETLPRVQIRIGRVSLKLPGI